MPPMMGLMTLSRLIMYFCGDYDSWDPRAMMMGMGDDGRRWAAAWAAGWAAAWAAMGGGMRSVPTAGPPSADLRPRQTRNLATCVVSLTTPDAEGHGRLPAEGEEVRIVGDIAQVNERCGRAEGAAEAGGDPGTDVGLATGDVAGVGRPGLGDDRRSSRRNGPTATS